jgi:hypothetical protein
MYQRFNPQLLDFGAKYLRGDCRDAAGIIGQADGMNFTSARGFSGIFNHFCLGRLK